MKKILFCLMTMSLLTLVGCGNEYNEMIWDVAPLNVRIYVQDKDGNDLLDSSASDLINNDIKVVYNGKDYPLGVDVSKEPQTKAYLAVLRGLHLEKYGNDNYLIFGEFDGAVDWFDSFEIDWGDGTKDEIVFHHDFEWEKDGSPKVVSSELYLNEKKVEGKLVIIKSAQPK